MVPRTSPARVPALLTLAVVLTFAASLANCSCKDDKSDPYLHNTDGSDDDVTPPSTDEVVATPSTTDRCVFEATIDGMGTITLEAARVGGHGPLPTSVTISHGTAGEATSRTIARGIDTSGGGETGWAATRFEGDMMGTELNVDGTWRIRLEIEGDSCESAPPVTLTLIRAG